MRAALIVLFGVSSISVVLRFNVGELLSFFAGSGLALILVTLYRQLAVIDLPSCQGS
jgi:hypothetical protein